MIVWRSKNHQSKEKALFLDRDGIVNRKVEGGYVLKAADFNVLAEFIGAVKPFVDVGVPLVIISNQACVGRGLIEKDALANLMEWVIARLADMSIPIAGYIICPHSSQDRCLCRKPAPGMLLEARRAFGVDLSRCAFIGDSETDVEAGRRAGCPTFFADPLDSRTYLAAFASAFDILGDEKCLISR